MQVRRLGENVTNSGGGTRYHPMPLLSERDEMVLPPENSRLLERSQQYFTRPAIFRQTETAFSKSVFG